MYFWFLPENRSGCGIKAQSVKENVTNLIKIKILTKTLKICFAKCALKEMKIKYLN